MFVPTVSQNTTNNFENVLKFGSVTKSLDASVASAKNENETL